MNALLICLSNSWGGLEQVAANDALDLGELGLKVQVICFEGSPIHQCLVRYPEIKLIPLNYKPRNILDFRLKNILRDLVENQGINVIHTHQPSLLGSIIPWVWRRPDLVVMATRHIMNTHDKRDLIHRLLYQRLDAFVVVSQTIRQNVLATHPLRERQVKVIHLGLDFDAFDPEKVDSRRQ